MDNGQQCHSVTLYYIIHAILLQDSILIGENLIFDFEDKTEVPPLQPFLHQLANQVIRNSFYQHEPKGTINLLKIPQIMPDCLLGKMTNTESGKKSLMNSYKSYKEDVLAKLIEMVSEKRLDLLHLDELAKGDRLKEVAREIGIPVSKKSKTVLLEEVKAVARIFLAGQGFYLLLLSNYFINLTKRYLICIHHWCQKCMLGRIFKAQTWQKLLKHTHTFQFQFLSQNYVLYI